jgi:phosphate transport system permease protein
MTQQLEQLEQKELVSPISRPPSGFDVFFDRAFRGLTWSFAWLTILILVVVLCKLGWEAREAVQKFGLEFLIGKDWNLSKQQFGVRPQIWGTLYSSVLGVGIGALFGVAVAIFLTQDFLPRRLEVVLKNVIELLAAIPSVVYGLWGIFVVIPAIRPAAHWIHARLDWFPLFGTDLSGPGLLPAALVLAIMVLPTITAISRDALVAVPPKLREAAFGLGATRWEAILAVILPTASRGIYGSIILGFGRALGETMALAMLAGGSNTLSWSLFSPVETLAALLATHFGEAKELQLSALMYAALVLLGITLLINVLGTLLMRRSALDVKGAK